MTAAAGLTLYADSSFYTVGGRVDNIDFQDIEAQQEWIGEGVTVSGDTARKEATAADGWGNAAFRSKVGYAGGATVSWTVSQNNKYLMVGLNSDPTTNTSYDTIDYICVALEPLGDTLAVVINLQNAAARNGDELEILSRNCQLAPGDHALFQAKRQVDVVAPELRAQHRATQERMQEAQARKAHDDPDNAAALQAIPEMNTAILGGLGMCVLLRRRRNG